ncbi:transmembrane emp24 domain-containing protein 9-like [Sebastes fasciatus]|uniref:transmembrane emp24 domain-containing protein 9-like n=1 Tax=Sebastes fasciatus TaxID=394691 RepID=UPI003D9F787A
MKMASVSLLTVLLLNVFYSFSSSLHFHLRDTERTCFIEEIPDDTALTGHYWTQLYDEQKDEYLPAPQDIRIDVRAIDPDYKVILSRSNGSEGFFKFTSRSPGEHQICLQSNSPQRPLPAGGKLAVHLDIRVGERRNNYNEIAAKEKLTELQLRVRQLMEQVEQILQGQNYHRLREIDFREVDHNTNMWIFWWPVVRSLYVVLFIIWHTKSW